MTAPCDLYAVSKACTSVLSVLRLDERLLIFGHAVLPTTVHPSLRHVGKLHAANEWRLNQMQLASHAIIAHGDAISAQLTFCACPSWETRRRVFNHVAFVALLEFADRHRAVVWEDVMSRSLCSSCSHRDRIARCLRLLAGCSACAPPHALRTHPTWCNALESLRNRCLRPETGSTAMWPHNPRSRCCWCRWACDQLTTSHHGYMAACTVVWMRVGGASLLPRCSGMPARNLTISCPAPVLRAMPAIDRRCQN